ncbi:MAG: TonB-dependent receptor [Pseudomonadota bacterium]
MRKISMIAPGVIAAMLSLTAQGDELRQLRTELEQLKQTYETRIQVLERRLQEMQSAEPSGAAHAHANAGNAPAAPSPQRGVRRGNAFNPNASVILNATFGEFSRDPAMYALPGFALGEDSGPGEEGFALGEAELIFDANIDDRFYGSLTLALATEDGETKTELEEAYIQTLGLPAGFTAKAGRFYSRIGYLNEFHPHVDDFVDRPLAYRALLAGQYGDDGVQLRWVAPTDLFLEIGGEVLRGANFPAGGAAHDGKGAASLFAHLGGDVGVSHSWRAGLSHLHAQARERKSDDGDNSFSGDSDVTIADFIWKWAPQGNPSRTNFKFQTEYLHRAEDGLFNDLDYSGEQNGAYAQGVYQFMPKWRAGVRYDWLEADNRGAAVADSVLDTLGHDPWRASALLEYDPSEFSRLRLQYNRDASQPDVDHQLFLNFVMSLGAHGAHAF